MYETHFGLRKRPFRAGPDKYSYYPATSHECALTRLHQALIEEEGLVLLTGAPGMGKTLLCHCLLERLGADASCAFLTHSRLGTCAGLLQAILYDLSLPYDGRSEQELRLALSDHLLKQFASSGKTVLVIDEAQHLTPDMLEELRLLGNLEANDGKALQVVLAGQPGVNDTLRLPELISLSQRLAVRVLLEPMNLQEAADYLLHQVRLAGGKAHELWSEEALELLARGTGGVPRLLNQAAHQALTLACAAGASLVDAEAVLEALNLLGLESTLPEPSEEPEAGEPLEVAPTFRLPEKSRVGRTFAS